MSGTSALNQEIDWSLVPPPVEDPDMDFFAPIKKIVHSVAKAAGVKKVVVMDKMYKKYPEWHGNRSLPRTAQDLFALLYPAPNDSLLSDSAALTYEKREKEVAEMFKTPYIDDDRTVDIFIDYIRSCAAKWDPMKFLAPYCAIIQSSGVGKSRLVTESGSHCWLFYICCREKSTGFPYRSDVTNYLTKGIYYAFPLYGTDNFHHILFILFLAACLERLRDYVVSLELNGSPPTQDHFDFWKKMQIPDDHFTPAENSSAEQGRPSEFWSEIIDRFKANVQRLINQGHFEVFKNDAPKDAKSLDLSKEETEFAEACLHAVCAELKAVTRDSMDADDEDAKNSSKSELILFAFDEAQHLLDCRFADKYSSTYNLIRAALAKLPNYSDNENFHFSVMLDTHGQISKLHPKNMRDSSARFFFSQELYYPFWSFPFHRDLKIGWDKKAAPGNPVFTRAFAYSGRYLWKAYFDKHKDWNRLIEDACLKLVLKSKHSLAATERDELAQMAVASVRLCLQFLSSSQMAESLVHSYMATCTYISPDSDQLMVHYPSEPVLAVAANVLMVQCSETLGWNVVLPELERQIQSGMVENGYRGELVARIILSYTWDFCWSARVATSKRLYPTNKISPVSLNIFLQALGGEVNSDVI